ncbi:hypothetical protein [Allobranchiibius sp. CTAmp26]|uniref:hypothetical protein n=1 Tax=Allobranchiibius sp. CTAmp26 TaxID=2815214 RepID=UPI001AA11E5D|nr:hypothetical protein [Allobranchiibius sp. CTAmp26]MBO1756826.1 hypothetical protein [Allobranchiibius sp. CTAmp26]
MTALAGFSALSAKMSPERLSLLFPALGVLLVVLLAARTRPRAAAGLWFVVICFVPCWVQVTLKYSFPAATILSILLVLAAFPTVPKDFGIGDWMMIGFFLFAIAPYLFGLNDRSSTMILLTYWGPAYLLGRTMVLRTGVDWLYRCAAALFTVVAVGAVIEFAFSWNPFVGIRLNNALYQTWGTLQERGGVLRAEGAFGHSIALGASIALVIPLVIASRFSLRTRALMVLAMLAAEVATFSRAGMVSAALAVALMALFGREGLSPRLRGLVLAVLVVVAICAAPLVTGTYAKAGTEASNSADYRLSLTSLIPRIALVGKSPDMYVSANGTHYVGQFRSIDSALILLGLTYGLIPLLIMCAMLLGGVYLLVSRQATAPTVAVVAQLPAFLSVAMITQYQVLVWFMVGLAVCTQAMRNHDDHPVPTAIRRPAPLRRPVHASSGSLVASRGND